MEFYTTRRNGRIKAILNLTLAIPPADVNHMDLTFLETTIPPTETNYYCMTFDLPNDQDYHMIATEPIMDNMEVLHHILVYECEDGEEI